MEGLFNAENWAVLAAAAWKLLGLWWPVIVTGIVGLFWVAHEERRDDPQRRFPL